MTLLNLMLQADDGFPAAFCGLMLFGLAVPVLFGFWGKSRAEDHDVSPWLGFVVGFMLGWIGLLIIPALRTKRLTNPTPQPQYFGPPPQQYAPPPQQYMPPPQQYAPPPQAYAPPPQPYAPPPQAYAPPPQHYAPPPSGEPAEVLVVDDEGYVTCPGCGVRVAAGRRQCMSCGYRLPPVFDPKIRGA